MSGKADRSGAERSAPSQSDESLGPAPGFGDYFTLLKQLTGMGVAANHSSPLGGGSPIDQLKASLDPSEIDRKIRDLETVLVWVRAQQGAIELSIKALEFQRNMLNEIGIGKAKLDQATANMPDLAALTKDFNPAGWAWQNLQGALAPRTSTPKPKARRPAAKPRTRKQ